MGMLRRCCVQSGAAAARLPLLHPEWKLHLEMRIDAPERVVCSGARSGGVVRQDRFTGAPAGVGHGRAVRCLHTNLAKSLFATEIVDDGPGVELAGTERLSGDHGVAPRR